MGTASSGEWIAILLYFALVIGVGVYFFIRDRHVEGEKEYFLGGRSMGGWVAALSAGASDMSAWVLMGLPGSIYLYGIGKVWIAVGLVIGTICAWVFVAPRLRRYSIRANDSITIPQFLTNRFQSKNRPRLSLCAAIWRSACAPGSSAPEWWGISSPPWVLHDIKPLYPNRPTLAIPVQKGCKTGAGLL